MSEKSFAIEMKNVTKEFKILNRHEGLGGSWKRFQRKKSSKKIYEGAAA